VSENLEFQIERLYAAIGAAQEKDPVKLRAKVWRSERGFGMGQDFRGGQTDAQLMNTAQTIIATVANFGEHLKNWARASDRDPKKVDEAVKASFELQVILDLANFERHPHPARNDGRSKKNPKVKDVNRVMQLSTRPVKGSAMAMQVGRDGMPRFLGDGDARAVVTGDVVAVDGVRIGDLQGLIGKAIEAWRRVMVVYEIARGVRRE